MFRNNVLKTVVALVLKSPSGGPKTAVLYITREQNCMECCLLLFLVVWECGPVVRYPSFLNFKRLTKNIHIDKLRPPYNLAQLCSFQRWHDGISRIVFYLETNTRYYVRLTITDASEHTTVFLQYNIHYSFMSYWKLPYTELLVYIKLWDAIVCSHSHIALGITFVLTFQI